MGRIRAFWSALWAVVFFGVFLAMALGLIFLIAYAVRLGWTHG